MERRKSSWITTAKWRGAQYKAWGEVKEQRSEWAQRQGLKSPIRFQGQYHDHETGQHYNRYRYYDPRAGRFISKDPISYAGGLNLYAYAPNPVEWVDRLGLASSAANATHIIFQGIDLKTDRHYIGYASMQGNKTGTEVLKYRYASDCSRFAGGAPEVLYTGHDQAGKDTARGLEQRRFEQLGRLEGTANKQNPVGAGNARNKEYIAAADSHLEKRNLSGSTSGPLCNCKLIR